MKMLTDPIFWFFFILVMMAFNFAGLLTLKFSQQFRSAAWWRRHYVMFILFAAMTLAVSAINLYLIDIGISVVGLVDILRDSIGEPKTTPQDFRNLGTAVALLMGVLAASATIFFSIIRVWINERTASAAEEALFNDKINAAFSDLHAQRQVTKWYKKVAQNVWESDITRRNGAIDRLLGLATQEPDAAPRIARILSVYVKELSREFPPKDTPQSDDPKLLREWARTLKVVRSDMQNAVQVLGRLRKASGAALNDGEIDLEGANLQRFDLTDLDLQHTSLFKAQLQGTTLTNTNLCGAQLIGSQFVGASLANAKVNAETSLGKANFMGATIQLTDLSSCNIELEQLRNAFGDASVTLPKDIMPSDPRWPSRWSTENLNLYDFILQSRNVQATKAKAPTNPPKTPSSPPPHIQA